MATSRTGKKLPSKTGSSGSNFYPPNLPVAVAPVRQPIGEEIMGWVAAVILVGFMIPMLGILYLDILDAKNEVKAQAEKIERLRRQIERENRDKTTGTKL